LTIPQMFLCPFANIVRIFRGVNKDKFQSPRPRPRTLMLSSVSLLTVLVSLSFIQQPVNAHFCLPIVWKFIHQLRRFISLQLVYLKKLKCYLRCWKPCLQTLQWRLQWRTDNSSATDSRGGAATHFRCGVGNVIINLLEIYQTFP